MERQKGEGLSEPDNEAKKPDSMTIDVDGNPAPRGEICMLHRVNATRLAGVNSYMAMIYACL